MEPQNSGVRGNKVKEANNYEARSRVNCREKNKCLEGVKDNFSFL